MAKIESFQQLSKNRKSDVIGWFFRQSIFIKSATFAIAAFLLISPIIFGNTYQANFVQHASGVTKIKINIPQLSPTQGQFKYDCLLSANQACSMHACAVSG